MKLYVKLCVYITIVNLLIVPSEAYAYIDPGTGSLLLSVIVSIFATGLFFVRGLIGKVISFYYVVTGKKSIEKTHGIVFYSEGGQYWNCFKPIIAALSEKGVSCTYLTSDENDIGLAFLVPHVKAYFIGKGNRAYVYLNMLEADICVMTSPGLDVYQLRRSSGVKHYAHIVHAPGEVSLYRRYGLDYYDSVLTSGVHQENSIRCLEAQRNIVPKRIFHSGCPYYDVLMKKKRALEEKDTYRDNTVKNILIAPTWGVNGLLTRYGMDLLSPLIETGYTIIIRPHPQSLIMETNLLQELQSKTQTASNVQWDTDKDNFLALSKAHALISDYSSIIFDFAFVFERPVLTLDFEPDLLSYDAYQIPEKPWEFTVQHRIGAKLHLEDIPRLGDIVQKLLENKAFIHDVQNFRNSSVYNFGKSGSVIAEQLIEIKKTLHL